MTASTKTQRINLRDYTPQEQLDHLCEILRQPHLPAAELNRLLQLRYSWHRVRGLPPQAVRAMERLVTYLPDKKLPEPKKDEPKKDEPKKDEVVKVSKGGAK